MSERRQLQLFEAPPLLRRAEAERRLSALIGEDLRPLADHYGVRVWVGEQRNKGWAGQVVEHFLGAAPNARQAADFGDWELKVIPLHFDARGALRLKETMSITMFTAEQIEAQPFEESHLFEKLRRLLIVARVYEDEREARSLVAAVCPADLTGDPLKAQIREDYEEIRWWVRHHGLHALHGGIGRWVQPRPKGGAGSFNVGFYARKALVAHLMGLPGLVERAGDAEGGAP